MNWIRSSSFVPTVDVSSLRAAIRRGSRFVTTFYPLNFLLCYLTWAAVFGLSYVVFVVWQQTFLYFLVDLRASDQWVSFAMGLEILFLGSAAAGYTLMAESYLREGLGAGQLRKRSVRLLSIAAGLAVVGVLLQDLLRLV